MGLEINRLQKFVLRFSNKCLIGGYNCTFNKKTLFVYKSKTDVSGYMLRKQVWLELMNEYGIISEYFRQNIEQTYLNNIKNKILIEKTKYLKSIDGLEGNENILMVINKNEKPISIRDKNIIAEKANEVKQKQKQDMK